MKLDNKDMLLARFMELSSPLVEWSPENKKLIAEEDPVILERAKMIYAAILEIRDLLAIICGAVE